MSEKKLHIVALDNPHPADYGGAIDMYYRIKTLAEAGIKITLHIFYKNRKPADEWAGICEEVYSYKRKTGFSGISAKTPYIVYSRRSKKLLNNLLKDNSPILFEGIHTCFHLSNKALKKRKKLVRLHNVEHAYYYDLYKNSGNLLKRLYYRLESDLLCQFERYLKHADVLFPISHKETKHFKALYSQVVYLSPFSEEKQKPRNIELENYCIYHGNLSVSENEKAVFFLINEVFSNLKIKLIIAGKKPGSKIQSLCNRHPYTSLVANPNKETLEELLSKAKIHVLYSNQDTGIKLKLIESLRYSGEVIISGEMNDGNMFSKVCHIANNTEEFKSKILALSGSNDTSKQNDKTAFLEQYFSNQKNAQIIIEHL
ncbi:MAG: hypothetical protein ACK4K0_05235 [Flavobacteriales bacterium]